MSRTKRKHKRSFERYYHDRVQWHYNSMFSYWVVRTPPTRKEAKREYEQETRGKNWIDYTVPREHRNMINRQRRQKDRQEIWREVNYEEYEAQCSDWNCKDAKHWDFW